MSQEIQLAFNRTPAAQIEPWAMGGGAAPGGPLAAQANPLHKIHRSMRGRYLLAGVLALLGAAAGGAAGYMVGEAGYVSRGAIQVRPTIHEIDKADTVMQMYDRYMKTQAAILMSERLMQFAVKHPEWKASNPQPAPTPVQAFAPGLKAEFLPNSEIIQVTYTHPDPRVAQAGVRAVIKSYDENFARQESEGLGRKLETWENIRREATRNRDVADKRVEELGRKHRTQDVTIFDDAAKTDLMQLRKELDRAKAELQQLEAPGPASEDMSVEDIAQTDSQMARNLQIRDMIVLRVEELKISGAGPNMRRMVEQNAKLKHQDSIIEDRAQWFREKYKGYRFVPGAGTDGAPGMDRSAIVPRNVEEVRAAVEHLRARVQEQQELAADMSDVRQEIAAAKEASSEYKAKARQAEEQIERLNFRVENLGRVQIVDEGNLPSSPLDNRTKLMLVGVVGGGAIPLGLLLMVGLLDTRYRYSDEASSADMQGITLLGILPNLPDRLSDPEQAAIAAHCVHQIRTMLQINGGANGLDGGGDRRVFAITSASPGDGKTSLTLALGLSYAACGTRTLLIDCDLVGAGLSTRMNVHASEGVLEAIANRSMLQYVRTTDIADVAILPVGSAHGYHASTLSPGALRRLIDEAKKHFDTILVDTGPVLGSIEASLVCAAADGVVLAVSRGQSRPLVEKSLAHLNGIGARLAGVVFNRAQSNDFERSISGMSMRSVAAANGKHGGNGRDTSATGESVGPVARAVAPHAPRAHGYDGYDGNGSEDGR